MRLRKWLAVGVIALVACTVAVGQPSGVAPTRAHVASAVAQLKNDPNLETTRPEKTLKFKSSTEEKPQPKRESTPWLVDLIQWLAESARLLMWGLGAVLVALLLVGIRRWIQVRGASATPRLARLPSHVQSLDIRPESLPEAIGAAAAALWQQGRQVAALSLLYRGLLSRLVHVHAVPIRAASTEDECVSLARSRLTGAPAAFVAQLVGTWQTAVYGARLPASDQVLALCRDFDLHLRVGATPESLAP